MKKMQGLLLVTAMFGLFSSLSSAWWDSNWLYNATCTVNTGVNSNLTDFPEHCSIDTHALVAAGKLQENCQDIRVIDQDGVTQLPYELESGQNNCSLYGSADRSLDDNVVYFKLPQTSGTDNYTVYIFYGNPSAVDAQNASAVWSNGYNAVYHFGMDTNDTFYSKGGMALDSSGHGNNLALNTNCYKSVSDPRIFGALNDNTPFLGSALMGGSGCYGAISSTNLVNPNNFTTTFWSNVYTFENQSDGYGTYGAYYTLSSGSVKMSYRYTDSAGGSTTRLFSGFTPSILLGDTPMSVQTPYVTTFSTDGSSVSMWENATLVNRTSVTGTTAAGNCFLLGASPRGNTGICGPSIGNFRLTGRFSFGMGSLITEMRIASVQRSDDWIQAESSSTDVLGSESLQPELMNENQG